VDRRFDVITFDCYGTLIDWEAGIGSAFENAAASAGVDAHRPSVLAAYAAIEPAVQSERYRPYREVLAETSARVARREGWELGPGSPSFLAESLPLWPPFPDTDPALRRLAAAGMKLGILSNVDDDLLAATQKHFSVPFDCVVTAQQVGAYKPAEAHFREARRRLGNVRWLHAAQSYFHDVVPARALGIPVAWVNRKGEKPSGPARADFEVRDLSELASFLVDSSSGDTASA
jgi:2-haloalkanoic acid dehalogenase type II